MVLHKELTDRIIGVFYGVYNELGYGFVESVYEKAMLVALEEANIPVQGQVPMEVFFRGRSVGTFRADLVVEEKVILELKTSQTIEVSHERQLLNYLRSTPCEVGLLLNFGEKPQFKRFVYSNEKKRAGGSLP